MGTGEEGVYNRLFKAAVGQQKDRFWEKEAEKLHWEKRWEEVLDTSSAAPASLWFPGGLLNLSYNSLDIHVLNGRGDQPAVIYDSPLSSLKLSISYSNLLSQVELFAGVLTKYGCMYDGKNTKTVLIYMPNSIEAVIAMLACARIGAPHAVVFGGFASVELANRIRHCKPHVIVASSCGIEPKGVIPYKPLLDEALSIVDPSAHPKKCVIFQRPQCQATLHPDMDVDWIDAMRDSDPIPAVPVSSNHPLYILYTSGTTGDPKGIVRDTAGYAVALNWSMRHIFDIKSGDTFWAASDVGWVVGHSYIVYGPLLNGATTVIFEGKPVGTPNAGAYWRMISEYQIKSLFCAPTSLRAIKRDDPDGVYLKQYEMTHFKSLFLAGERADPDTVMWASHHLNRPVIDNYWQTETGWPIVSNYMNLEQFKVKFGSATKPVPGYDLQILDDEGHLLPPNTLGNISIKLPLPPGCFTALWKSEKGLKESSYFKEHPEYYHTGDSGYVDDEGYVYIMSRTGDIINVAGHRLSTGALEEIICSHPSVAECAVIGIYDEVKGQVPLGFVLLKSNASFDNKTIIQQIVQSVRKNFGAVAFFRNAIIVDKLPKTRSGKILRGLIQKIVEGAPFKYPPTIEDISALDHIHEKLLENGYKPHPQL